jgi:hypothetical protein
MTAEAPTPEPPTPTPEPPVVIPDLDVTLAYKSLKRWAERNGVA